jgi:hypothetical protein
VNQVSGPNGYSPGFTTELGWKFRDGSALSVSYMYLVSNQTRAVATLAAPGLQVRSDFADSFLTSSVYNFPNDYAGPSGKLAVGGPQAAFGIWNGSSIQTLEFLQRSQQIEATYRVPIYENEYIRLNGLVGPRFFWIWERFKWRTTDLDTTGNSAPQWVGIYTNIDSNRMYGIHTGLQSETYLGCGIATMLTMQGALFIDSVKERAKYELGTKFSGPANKRARRIFTVVPELQVTPSICWYPTEAVQLRIGYDVMAFFNTISSPQPIDFNYGSLTPTYEHTYRFFDGFNASIAINF